MEPDSMSLHEFGSYGVLNAEIIFTGTSTNFGCNPAMKQADEDRFPSHTNVKVLRVLSWCELSVTRLDELLKYKNLAYEVAVACIKGKPLRVRPPVNALRGAFCKADKMFYRARILKREGDEIHVLYVDFGKKDIVEMCDLRELPSHIPMEAPGALVVKLLNIPLVTTAVPVPVVNYLISETPFEMVYNGKISDGVELISDGFSLNEIIITELFTLPYKVQNVLALEEGNQELLILSCMDLDTKGILYCARGRLCEVNCVLTVIVDDLRQYCSGIDVKAYSPHVGEVCAVLMQTDGIDDWWRVSVIRNLGGTRSLVFFIDYGVTWVVDHAQIRPLTPDLQNTCAIANTCFIRGYPNYVDSERKAHISQVLQKRYITANVKRVRDIFELEIP